MPRKRRGASPRSLAPREAAQQLDETKDALLAAMSHDLRSPLGSILVWLELLRAQDLEPAAARAAGMIDRGVRDLREMVGQFLDMALLLAGKLRLERHPTDLLAVVDAVLATAKTIADVRGVRLESRIDRSLPSLRVDARRLRQGLESLVVSAVNSTPPGGSVHVQLENLDDRILIEVRDSGAGLRPEQLSAVFDQFRTGDTPARGTLGLAIAQRVAVLHGGRIRASSDGEGRGCVFVLELPITGPSAGSPIAPP